MAALHPDRNFSTIAGQARSAGVVLAQLEHAQTGALLAGEPARRALSCDSADMVQAGAFEVRRTLHMQGDGSIAADELRTWLKTPCTGAGTPLRVVVNEGAGPYLARPCQMGADVVVEDLGELLGHGLDGLAFVGARTDAALGAFLADLHGGNCEARARRAGEGAGPVCSFDAGAEVLDEAERALALMLPQLALIVQARCDRALVAAQFLVHHPRVFDVFYPGLQDDPANPEARRSLEHGFGWRVGFRLPSDACGFADGLWNGPMGSLASHVEQLSCGMCVLHAGLEEPLDVVGALEKGIARGEAAVPRA